MNDFTKDELEELYFFTCVHKKKYRVKYPQELLDKLQSMIDNYCEHEIMTADMKEYQAIYTLNENGQAYFTITSDTFAFGPHASLNIAHKIICALAIGANHFDNEWIDRIIFRLQELKNDNHRFIFRLQELKNDNQ